MKSNELRIGNWVRPAIYEPLVHGERKYFAVNVMMIRDCEHYGNNWAFEPIPITPEILGKCGFAADNNQYSPIGIFYKLVLSFDEGKEPPYFVEEIKLVSTGEDVAIAGLNFAKVKYLHQLQNLVLAITGEELNVKM